MIPATSCGLNTLLYNRERARSGARTPGTDWSIAYDRGETRVIWERRHIEQADIFHKAIDGRVAAVLIEIPERAIQVVVVAVLMPAFNSEAWPYVPPPPCRR